MGTDSERGAPVVSILIVTYRNREDLEGCLNSISSGFRDPGTRFEVIVVDNASDDGTATVIQEHYPWVQLIRSETNLGFGRACNLAACHSSGEYLLLLNPDTVVLPFAFDSLLDLARRRPQAGLYGGRTITPDGHVDPRSAWGSPTLWSLFCFGTGLSSLARGSSLFDPECLPHWDRDTEREVPVVTGCLLLARRDAWLVLGGFDERYFMYGEDADLSMRAWAAGFRPVITPEATIVHVLGGSVSTSTERWTMVMKGKATLVRAHFSMPARLIAVAMLWTGVGLRAAAASVAPRVGRSIAEPHWSGVWRRRTDWWRGWPPMRTTPRTPTQSGLPGTSAGDARRPSR